MIKYGVCKVPDCGRNIVLGHSKADLCTRHTDFLNFFLWALNNIEFKGGVKDKLDNSIIKEKEKSELGTIKVEEKDES